MIKKCVIYMAGIMIGVIVGIFIVASYGCDNETKCSPGVEGCACYGNGTCNEGLVCRAGVCRAEEDAEEDVEEDVSGEDIIDDDVVEDPDPGEDIGPDPGEDIEEEPGVACTDYTGQDPDACPEGQVCRGDGVCIELPEICTQETVTHYEAYCEDDTVVICTAGFSRMEGDVEVFYIGFSGETLTCGSEEICFEYEFMLRGGEGACDGPLPWATCIPQDATPCDITVNSDCLPSPENAYCDSETAFNCYSMDLDTASEYAEPMQGLWVEENCAADSYECRLTPYNRAVCVHPDAILCTEWFQYCDGDVRHRCEPDAWEEIQDCSATGDICWDGCAEDPADSVCVPAGTEACDPFVFVPYCVDDSTLATCAFYCAVMISECICYILEDGELIEVPCDCVESGSGAECVVVE